MIGRFYVWLRESHQWKKDHLSSWQGLKEPNAQGITGFQMRAMEALKQAGVQLDFSPRGKSEIYLHAALPNSDAEIFLYVEGAQLVGDQNYFVGEEWDFRTADELIDKLVSATIARARST